MTGFIRGILGFLEERTGKEVYLKVDSRSDGTWKMWIRIEDGSGDFMFPLFSLYHEYRQGTDIKDLTERVIKEYETAKMNKIMNSAWIGDWEQVKERVVYRISKKEEDRDKEWCRIKVLEGVSVEFFIILDIRIPGIMEKAELFPVTYSLAKRWRKSKEELMEQAQKNTEGLFCVA